MKTRISQYKSDLGNPPTDDITALVRHFAILQILTILDKESNCNTRKIFESLHICTKNTYDFRRDTSLLHKIINATYQVKKREKRILFTYSSQILRLSKKILKTEKNLSSRRI